MTYFKWAAHAVFDSPEALIAAIKGDVILCPIGHLFVQIRMLNRRHICFVVVSRFIASYTSTQLGVRLQEEYAYFVTFSEIRPLRFTDYL